MFLIPLKCREEFLVECFFFKKKNIFVKKMTLVGRDDLQNKSTQISSFRAKKNSMIILKYGATGSKFI